MLVLYRYISGQSVAAIIAMCSCSLSIAVALSLYVALTSLTKSWLQKVLLTARAAAAAVEPVMCPAKGHFAKINLFSAAQLKGSVTGWHLTVFCHFMA